MHGNSFLADEFFIIMAPPNRTAYVLGVCGWGITYPVLQRETSLTYTVNGVYWDDPQYPVTEKRGTVTLM